MAASAAVPFVSVEEYLRSDPQPDMDYADGVMEERNLGELEHSSLQRYFDALFYQKRKEWMIDAYPELRVQVAPGRFCVPDICVMPLDWKKTSVVREAPLLCLEIKSADFTLTRERNRAQDYLAMGVREVWIFDPEKRAAFVLTDNAMIEQRDGVLRLAGTAIEIDLAAVFAVLDE